MSNNIITLLILEDDDMLRQQLEKWFVRLGFKVLVASSVEDANIVLEFAESLDVAIVDQNLGTSISGTEYVTNLREVRFKYDPPECLVYSGEDGHEYYRKAIRAGAGAYLRKSDHGIRDLSIPVRALVLRKAMRFERRPQALADMYRFVARAGHRDIALSDIARNVLKELLRRALDNPFHLLVTTPEVTICIPSDGKPLEGDSFEKLQDRVQPCQILTVTETFLHTSGDWQNPGKTSFINLYQTESFKLSLGIVEVTRSDKYRRPDDQQALAESLLEFVGPTLMATLVNLTSILTSAHDASLDSFAQDCTVLSRQLKKIYEELQRPTCYNKALTSLDELAETLHHRASTAENILGISQRTDRFHSAPKPPYEADARKIAEKQWEEIAGNQASALSWESHSFAGESPRLLQTFFAQTFSWLKQRAEAEKKGLEVKINTVEKRRGHFLTVGADLEPLTEMERESLFRPLSNFHSIEHQLYELREEIHRRGGTLSIASSLPSKGVHFQLFLPRT